MLGDIPILSQSSFYSVSKKVNTYFFLNCRPILSKMNMPGGQLSDTMIKVFKYLSKVKSQLVPWEKVRFRPHIGLTTIAVSLFLLPSSQLLFHKSSTL